MNPWPHQTYAIEEVEKAIAADQKRILLTIPTGGGKTFVAASLIKIWRDQGFRTVVYTNRRLLVTQLSEMLDQYGITHGVRAAGRKERYDRDVQIASVQTEMARGKKAAKMSAVATLHDCQRVLVDEAHLQTGDETEIIINQHLAEGAVKVGLTATPVDLQDYYDVLIQAGLTSELRACGALVEAIHFGPDEPDLKAFKKLKKSLAQIESDTAVISEGQARDLIMAPGIFGRVWEWFEKLNPTQEPTILFAPGVAESMWFAEQFEAKGVKAAHIDGKSIWVDGETKPTTQKLRQEVLDGSREGRIAVLCNRFVLREGIDAPWLAHGIFATVFGSIQTYLQSGGRLLRSHPSTPLVRIQDHGGNWWRWGGLNADRTWLLGNTANMMQGMRADALRQKKAPEPFLCPQCRAVCMAGRCRACGWSSQTIVRSRPVIGTNGELKFMTGDIFRPRTIYTKANGPALWKSMYWRSRTRKIPKPDGTVKVVGYDRSFRSAEVVFAQENYWRWPDRRWPFMPKHEHDLYRLVGSVPFSDLIQESNRGQEDQDPS